VKITITSVSARLHAPFASSWGSVSARDLVLLRLEDRNGHIGVGEAAPLKGYDGVSAAEVRSALEDCRATLADAVWLHPAEVVADCARHTSLASALCAVDMALWDLAGRRAGQPAWRLLGAHAPIDVEVNDTIPVDDVAGAARRAREAAAAGFRCVKVKVGVEEDPQRVAAVRAAGGSGIEIRLDANGAWSLDEALAALRALAPFAIELCEEPVSGLGTIGELAAEADVALAIDETAADPRAFERRACEAICLKLSRCGGISGVLEAARRARAVGYEVYLGSMLEGPLGIAAALHAAAVIGPDRPCGLGTLALFADGATPLEVRGGRMRPPPGHGLGDGLIAWYDALGS